MKCITLALFLLIIQRELFEFLADGRILFILRTKHLKRSIGFTEVVQKTEMALLIEKAKPIILSVNINKL